MASATVASAGTATMSILGVMTSLTAISSSCITFDMTLNSSSSIAPSRRPSSAIISISARLTTALCDLPGAIHRLSQPSGTRTGFIATTMTRSRCAVGRASLFQNFVPIVFGMISERTSTATVSAAVKMPTATSPP